MFRYLEDESLTPLLKDLIARSAAPLKAIEADFAADSTGIGTKTYTRWFDAKYGDERREQNWLKLHIMTGVLTNVVSAVEVTPGAVNDQFILIRQFIHTKNGNDILQLLITL